MEDKQSPLQTGSATYSQPQICSCLGPAPVPAAALAPAPAPPVAPAPLPPATQAHPAPAPLPPPPHPLHRAPAASVTTTDGAHAQSTGLVTTESFEKRIKYLIFECITEECLNLTQPGNTSNYDMMFWIRASHK